MPLLLADFIHIKVCKPNLRKTLDTTQIERQFRIRCYLFAMFSSGTSSKKHHSAAAIGLDFPLFLCLLRLKF